MFKVTKEFIGGVLAGITIIEITSVEYRIGFICRKPIGGSPYKIVSVERI